MRTSIRTRLLVSFLAIALAAAGGLSLYFLHELEAYGLRKLEVRLDAEATLIAALLGTSPPEAGLDEALREVGGEVSTRLRVLDASGVSIADSAGETGESYADRPEIVSALAGEYGAHTRVLEGGRVALYVARPIVSNGEVVGAVYSSASTFSIMTLLRDYRAHLLLVVLAFLMVTAVTAELLVRWLSAPLDDLEDAAHAVAAGDHSVRIVPSGARETRAVAEAFNTMSGEIERVVTELQEEERRKARFVSDVSHELRTPLTSIRGTAETLLRGDVPKSDARRFLQTIVDEAERLARLADGLLVLQRIEGATGELRLGVVDLGDVVRRTQQVLHPIANERDVEIGIEGTAPPVLGDADRLQQVVANLLDNAIRVTPAGGVVRLVLDSDAASAVLRVSDEGPGIPEEDLPHLFERFYRTERSRARSSGGTGLGLAIVHAIVDAHGGVVSAESGPAQGATFTVRLPAVGD